MENPIAFYVLAQIATILGFIKFKNLSLGYRFFLFALLDGVFVDIIYYLLHTRPYFTRYMHHTLGLIHVIIESTLFYLAALYFLNKKKILKKTLIYLFVLAVVCILVLSTCGLSSIYTITIDLFADSIHLFMFLKVLTNTLSRNNLRDKISRLLIVVPRIIFTIYFISDQILNLILYNKENAVILVKLYAIIRFIDAVSYLSYILAFIWMPKREKFL